jgi:hypothetical protein
MRDTCGLLIAGQGAARGDRRATGDEEGAGVRGQHTSRGIKAGPLMGPAPIGCAYSRTRKSRDVSPVSDGIRRPTTAASLAAGDEQGPRSPFGISPALLSSRDFWCGVE